MSDTKHSLAVSVSGLCKTFGKLNALLDVSISIDSGEIYALIGPNGAGKTTLIKTIVGLLEPSKGSVSIFGKDINLDPVEAKKNFGYISDDPAPYGFLTGREFLFLTGNLRGVNKKHLEAKIEELISLFPLKNVIDHRMADYSRGSKQKVAFLASLISNPKLLIIDEPIVGLDPMSMKIFGKSLKKFKDDGGSILFATHLLDFAKDFANRIGIMVDGKIVREEKVNTNISIEKIYLEETGK